MHAAEASYDSILVRYIIMYFKVIIKANQDCITS